MSCQRVMGVGIMRGYTNDGYEQHLAVMEDVFALMLL